MSACGQQEDDYTDSNEIISESTVADTFVNEELSKQEVVEATSANIEVSDKNVTVRYAGDPFIKSVFATGSDMLYISGIKSDGEPFLGYMEREADVFTEFTVDMDEGMRPFNMTVDEQGRCHILWMSVEKGEMDGQSFDYITYEKSIITVIDNKGNKEKTINVSDVFSEEIKRPTSFAVDSAGNYYFENEKIIQTLQQEQP